MARKLSNWLDTYMEYTSETESPEIFNFWCGISAMAGAVRRRVWFDHGYFQVYPNQYVVLTSPPGRCKKSTALRLSMDILINVEGIQFTAESITREKLASDMSGSYVDGHSSITASISELGSLFASSGMDMVLFLTDIYDCPNTWTHKSKTGGTTKIKAPFLNMLSGTTPSWLATAMPLDNIGVGFTSRVVFVYSDEPRVQEPIQTLNPALRGLRQKLIEDLTHIANLSGEMKMSKEAYKEYSVWYKSRINQSRSQDTRLSGYFERKPIHLIKTAMLMSVANSDDLIITPDDLERAMSVLAEVEPGLKNAFRAVGKNPLSLDIEDIGLLVAKSEKGIPFAKILDMYKHSIDRVQLAEVMDILVTTGHAKVTQGKGGIIYYPNYVDDAVISRLAVGDGDVRTVDNVEDQIRMRSTTGITVQELLTHNIGRMSYDQIKRAVDDLLSRQAITIIKGDNPTAHRLVWSNK